MLKELLQLEGRLTGVSEVVNGVQALGAIRVRRLRSFLVHFPRLPSSTPPPPARAVPMLIGCGYWFLYPDGMPGSCRLSHPGEAGAIEPAGPGENDGILGLGFILNFSIFQAQCRPTPAVGHGLCGMLYWIRVLIGC